MLSSPPPHPPTPTPHVSKIMWAANGVRWTTRATIVAAWPAGRAPPTWRLPAPPHSKLLADHYVDLSELKYIGDRSYITEGSSGPAANTTRLAPLWLAGRLLSMGERPRRKPAPIGSNVVSWREMRGLEKALAGWGIRMVLRAG